MYNKMVFDADPPNINTALKLHVAQKEMRKSLNVEISD